MPVTPNVHCYVLQVLESMTAMTFAFIHSVVQTFAGVIHCQPLALAAAFSPFLAFLACSL